MKRYPIIPIFLIIISSIFLSGCQELDSLIEGVSKEEYITVIIEANARVYEARKEGDVYAIGTQVIFEMIKDGGERFTFYESTGLGGLTKKVSCSFNLYKEQDIECIAQITGVSTKWIIDQSFQTLTWEQVDAVANFGDTYTWGVTHTLYLAEGQR